MAFDFRVGDYFVTLRPYLTEFLETAFEWFLVAIWTSSGRDYARRVIEQMFEDPSRPAFQRYSDRCTPQFDLEAREYHWLKYLKKVRRTGYSLDRVLTLDDTPRKLQRSYGNHPPVRYLDWIRHQPNFRSIEMRNWRRGLADRPESAHP